MMKKCACTYITHNTHIIALFSILSIKYRRADLLERHLTVAILEKYYVYDLPIRQRAGGKYWKKIFIFIYLQRGVCMAEAFTTRLQIYEANSMIFGFYLKIQLELCLQVKFAFQGIKAILSHYYQKDLIILSSQRNWTTAELPSCNTKTTAHRKHNSFYCLQKYSLFYLLFEN